MNPVTRVKAFMESKGWWTEAEEAEVRDRERLGVMNALTTAEKRKKPNVDLLFTDVYKDMPGSLKKQQQELREKIARLNRETFS